MMAVGVLEILAGLGILLLTFYYWLSSNFEYWKKRGVEGPKPVPLFGNFKDSILGKINDALLITKFYNYFKSEPLIGVFVKSSPKLIVKDLDLIKDILIKDFNQFADRGIQIHEKAEPFSLHLFNLEYDRWRPLRSKLSPIFTSGKLKDMFYLLSDCADHFQKYVEQLTCNDKPIECRNLTAKFTTDAIGVCAFGLNMKSIGKEDSEFRKFGRTIFEPNLRNKIKRLLRQLAPPLYDLIGTWLQPSSNKFFDNCIKETIRYRQENNVRRNDFIDLLMDLKNNPDRFQNLEFTHSLLVSQAFVFFSAGFETSATTMSNTLYELALNPHIQNKLRNEINEQLSQSNGQLTYESVKNMKYLDKVMKESLRKYPPGTLLLRSALNPYTFNDTKVTVPKGMRIFIPVWAIHRDPDIYPNPEVYDPERFSEENENARHPMAYLPFGDGPRNCIGARFANFQSKVGIVAIIQKFKVDVCEETCKKYEVVPRSIVPEPVGGIRLKITKL